MQLQDFLSSLPLMLLNEGREDAAAAGLSV